MEKNIMIMINWHPIMKILVEMSMSYSIHIPIIKILSIMKILVEMSISYSIYIPAMKLLMGSNRIHLKTILLVNMVHLMYLMNRNQMMNHLKVTKNIMTRKKKKKWLNRHHNHTDSHNTSHHHHTDSHNTSHNHHTDSHNTNMHCVHHITSKICVHHHH